MLGGTPQYQEWAGSVPFATALRDRVLSKGEPLYEEPLELIRGEDEIREPGNYFEIMRAIAQGATRVVEIESRTKISSSPLLRTRLKNLQRLGYVEEARTLGGTGTVSWQIADPFFAFWFRYVFPNRSRLSQGRVEEVAEDVLADFDNYMGRAFERICLQWVSRYADFEELRRAERIGSYWTRTHDVEVDLVAATRGRFLALGSCKWSKQADAHALDDLLESRERIREARGARLFMFARGFHPALVKRAAEYDVQLIGADRLFGDGPGVSPS